MAKVPRPVFCGMCGKKISRRADLPRHEMTHAPNKEELKIPCTVPGCTYAALQPANLATHMNTHTGEKPNKCPVVGCTFETSDPGSLTRHRKKRHGREPAHSTRDDSAAASRQAARQRRRAAPYPSSSSATPSSETTLTRTPCPQLLEMIDQSAPSSLVEDTVEPDTRNTNAAYLTKITNQFSQANNSANTPSPEPEASTSSTSGVLTTPEVPTVECRQLHVPEQAGFYAGDMSALPGSEVVSLEVSNREFDNFLAKFNDFQTPPTPAPASFHTVYNPHPADDISPYDLSSLLAHNGHTDNHTDPASFSPYGASVSLPSLPPPPPSLPEYGIENMADNAQHEIIDYLADEETFDAQFFRIESHAYPSPDMGIYPGAVDSYYTPYNTDTTETQAVFNGYY